MEVDMDIDSMLLSFARQLPVPAPGLCAGGATALLHPDPVPAVSLKLEPDVGVQQSRSKR